MIRATVLGCLLALPAAADDRRSGYAEMSAELQALQDDAMANPGLLTVLQGEAAFAAPDGAAQNACADCHTVEAMAGVAARYPAWDAQGAAPVDLPGRINLCRARHQQAAPLPRDDATLLALTSFVTHQSRGMPIAPDPDPRLATARAAGAAFFTDRIGQLNLSCAQCHDDNAGGRLAAATIPQAHPTGYPQYRLEWEATGSLHRRFGNCMFGVRATPLDPGDPTLIALELYLKDRAAGMAIESPAIRP